MIIFLYGKDSYRSKQKLEGITSRYKESKKSGLNLDYVDANEADFQDFYDNFKTVSMFKEKKLLVLNNVFLSKIFSEKLSDQVKNLEKMEDIVIIYENSPVDERTKLFKTLKKECKSQEFKFLNNGELKAWVHSEFEHIGKKANLDAVDTLAGYVGNDLWRMSNEIRKLADFKEEEKITREDVELMVRPKIESDIFKTVDAIAAKNKALAIQLLQSHIDSGDKPLYLLSMISWQFKNLLAVKELAERGLMYNSIVKKSGLHPFVVRKNYFACQSFSLEGLKKIYHRIFEIDSDVKTGKIEDETALYLLISSI